MPIEKIQEPGFDQKIKTQVVVKQSNMKRLRDAAKADNRSTSGQLNYIIESWFDHVAPVLESKQFKDVPF